MLNVVTDKAPARWSCAAPGRASGRAHADVAEPLVHAGLDAQQPHVRLGHLAPDEDDQQRRQRRQHERERASRSTAREDCRPSTRRSARTPNRSAVTSRSGPRTCGGTVSPTSACATAHSPPTPMPVTARAISSDQKPIASPDSQRADAVDQDREHQQRLAAEPIRHRAADEAADRGERERACRAGSPPRSASARDP